MYVLFDIGGTNTRVAVSPSGTELAEVRTFKTPHVYADGIRTIISEIIELAPDCAAVSHIAGCIRGRIDPHRSGLHTDSILTDWQNRPLVQDLSMACGVPVMLENDAALAALGEAHFGAGRGYDIVAYHTISTGVGGARVVGGVIDERSAGFEPGHQSIDVDRTLCPACRSGSLEDHVSGTSVEYRLGKKPYALSQADPLWEELAHWLAHGLNNTIAYWSPDIIVLGGSMMTGDPNIPLERVRAHLEQIARTSGAPLPALARAELGDTSGLYGGMALIRHTIGQV